MAQVVRPASGVLVEDQLLTPDSRVVTTGRAGGGSRGGYAALNLALHVGDEPDQVLGNRHLVAQHLRCPPEAVRYMNQVHGADVSIVTATSPATDLGPQADALVTEQSSLALAVLSADCVPVVLVDQQAGVRAVAHAGWRGVARDVMGATIAAMVGRGALPDRMRLHLGPAICGGCYRVGGDVSDQVLAATPEGSPVSAGLGPVSTWARSADGEQGPGLDLRAALLRQAVSRGVPLGSAVVSRRCTVEDPALYSHRRDGAMRPTGRQATIVAPASLPGEGS